jgi:membrane protease subunit HflK
MPWNDNAKPGPWGSPPPPENNDTRPNPPRRPSGGGGGGGRGPNGPDFNAEFSRYARRLRELLGVTPGGGMRPAGAAAIGGVIVAVWAASGIYVIQPNEEGVVTTFGAYSRSETPGLRYHLPAPIERVEKVPVTSLNRIDIGGTTEQDVPQESLMLTGDDNIVSLQFSVTWRVANAPRYLFSTEDPEGSVKAVAESALREVVGRMPLDLIISTGRGQVQIQTAELMQRTLDGWGTGVSVVEVQIRSAQVPAEVLAAYRDVSSAGQDRESAVNEARTYANRVINEAKGDAAKITESADGYREQSVREASGDAARFNSIYNEYRRAPGVTRERLYIETMQRVLARSNKVVVDGKGASAPIILPPDVFRPRTPAQPAPPPQAIEAAPSAPQ